MSTRPKTIPKRRRTRLPATEADGSADPPIDDEAAKPPLAEGRMNITEAGRQVGRSASTVWRWCRQGRRCGSAVVYLAALDLGGTLYFTEGDLLRFAEECARASRGRHARRKPREESAA